MPTAKLTPITEAEFTAQVIQLARLRGWRCAHFRGVRIQRKDGTTYYETPVQADGKGWPDIFAAKGPHCFAAELKRSQKEKPRPEQAAWLQAFLDAGIAAYVWTPESWSEIERVLTEGPPSEVGRLHRFILSIAERLYAASSCLGVLAEKKERRRA